jgi:hypothetical protein
MSRVGTVLTILLALAAAALAGVYAASPVLAFHDLQKAARAGDRDRLEALIDFPAVREDLKRQVDAGLVKLARKSSGVGFWPLEALGVVGSAVGDRAIDKLVTPEAIALMAAQGERPGGKRSKEAKGDADSAPPAPADKPVVRYAYLTPDAFRVSIAPAGHPDLPVGLILQRRGLFAWRVVAIRLPGGGDKTAAKAKEPKDGEETPSE